MLIIVKIVQNENKIKTKLQFTSKLFSVNTEGILFRNKSKIYVLYTVLICCNWFLLLWFRLCHHAPLPLFLSSISSGAFACVYVVIVKFVFIYCMVFQRIQKFKLILLLFCKITNKLWDSFPKFPPPPPLSTSSEARACSH